MPETTADLTDPTWVAPAKVRRLVVVYAPEPPPRASFLLTEDVTEIGRPGGTARIAIRDAKMSRRHARIERDPATDTFSIIDCESRNGSWVNGARLDKAALRHGTVVRTGNSLLVFCDDEVKDGELLEPETPALVGHSLAMQRLRGEIALVAPSAAPVLVVGETGVGKERVAEEVHRLSGRRGPLVTVNCAAIPQDIAESELFGHAQGAFTGATQRSEGLFGAADGGTLFLDEIGDLDAAIQGKLLRALATGEVRPVGRQDAQKVDVRIVAATHRDLTNGGRFDLFREDLYARLCGWTLGVVPLRERKDDVLRLAARFASDGRDEVPLDADCAEALLVYDWPRNVRELQQAARAAMVRGRGTGLRLGLWPEAITAPIARRGAASAQVAETPLQVLVPSDVVPGAAELRLALERFGGNVSRVAAYFDKDRKLIYRWASSLGIDLDALRDDLEG